MLLTALLAGLASLAQPAEPTWTLSCPRARDALEHRFIGEDFLIGLDPEGPLHVTFDRYAPLTVTARPTELGLHGVAAQYGYRVKDGRLLRLPGARKALRLDEDGLLHVGEGARAPRPRPDRDSGCVSVPRRGRPRLGGRIFDDWLPWADTPNPAVERGRLVDSTSACEAGDPEACAYVAAATWEADPDESGVAARAACAGGDGFGCGALAFLTEDPSAKLALAEKGCDLGDGTACTVRDSVAMQIEERPTGDPAYGALFRQTCQNNPTWCANYAEWALLDDRPAEAAWAIERGARTPGVSGLSQATVAMLPRWCTSPRWLGFVRQSLQRAPSPLYGDWSAYAEALGDDPGAQRLRVLLEDALLPVDTAQRHARIAASIEAIARSTRTGPMRVLEPPRRTHSQLVAAEGEPHGAVCSVEISIAPNGGITRGEPQCDPRWHDRVRALAAEASWHPATADQELREQRGVVFWTHFVSVASESGP